MDIVICINDSFISQAAVLAVSLLKNNGAAGTASVFHVLSSGVTEENQEKLGKMIRTLGGEAAFYDLGDIAEKVQREIGELPETGKFNPVVLARIFAAEYLPASVKKYLYLDADTVVPGDLSDLYGTDLSGFVLAACPEPTIYPELVVEQAEGKAYFNSGVLLVNREAWEAEQTARKCMAYFKEHNGKLGFADQDILNRVLAGKIRPLPQKYDFFTNYHYLSYREMTKMSPWYRRLVTKEEYETARKDPAIIHFAGDERPWYRGNRNPYRGEYEKYLSMTPWKDTEKIPGKEKYMAFYHAVNVLSARLPGFRRLTSKIYRRLSRNS